MKPSAGQLCWKPVGTIGSCQLLKGHIGQCDPYFEWAIGKGPTCPHCKSTNTVFKHQSAYGSGPTDVYYDCVDCLRWFLASQSPSGDDCPATDRAPKYDESKFCGRCGDELETGFWTKKRFCGACGCWADEVAP